MKSTDIKNHKTSISQTHNLEVLGSSPSWSTKGIKHLQRFCRCFFFAPLFAAFDFANETANETANGLFAFSPVFHIVRNTFFRLLDFFFFNQFCKQT